MPPNVTRLPRARSCPRWKSQPLISESQRSGKPPSWGRPVWSVAASARRVSSACPAGHGGAGGAGEGEKGEGLALLSLGLGLWSGVQAYFCLDFWHC